MIESTHTPQQWLGATATAVRSSLIGKTHLLAVFMLSIVTVVLLVLMFAHLTSLSSSTAEKGFLSAAHLSLKVAQQLGLEKQNTQAVKNLITYKSDDRADGKDIDEEFTGVDEDSPVETDAGSPDVSLESLRLCEANSTIFYICDNDATCHNTTCESKGRHIEFRDPYNWKRFWNDKGERRAILRSVLDRMRSEMGASDDRLIMLMTFNIGFAHLFGNWVCSLKQLLTPEAFEWIKRHTLVLPTDHEAIKYAKTLGFFSPTLEEITRMREWANIKHISRSAAYSFGQGSHSALNMFLKFAMPTDLISFGYTVMVQDVDITWGGNVLNETAKVYCPSGDVCDIIFIHEARPFISGRDLAKTAGWRRQPLVRADTYHENHGYPEGNTGMFLVQPTLRVQKLFKALLQASRLHRWKHRDQILFNTLAYHKDFSDVKIHFLPTDRFIPGKYTRPAHVQDGNPIPQPPVLMAIHASDTSSYKHKFQRLRAIDHWFFNETFPTCKDAVAACRKYRLCWEPVKASVLEILGQQI